MKSDVLGQIAASVSARDVNAKKNPYVLNTNRRGFLDDMSPQILLTTVSLYLEHSYSLFSLADGHSFTRCRFFLYETGIGMNRIVIGKFDPSAVRNEISTVSSFGPVRYIGHTVFLSISILVRVTGTFNSFTLKAPE